ncbi:hypothetical protein OAH12_01675, partial [Cyclobacteriaceae bacterium]|nr:hypothetical protein [Cyclobacteriaceae bacterium]
DKKKKTTHILVYVKRIDLIRFYRSQVDQNLSKIRNLIGTSNQEFASKHFQEAFKAVYSTHNVFIETAQAQKYLTALGVHSITELRTTDFEKLSTEAQSALKQIELSPDKNLDDITYCTSLVLAGQSIEKRDSMFVTQSSYEETGLVTAFSYRYQQLLTQELESNSSYSLQPAKSDYTKLIVKGTYWDKGDYLEIKNELYDLIKNTSLASFKSKLYKSKIEEGLEYVSDDIMNIENIKNIKLVALNTKLSGQVGFAVKQDFKVKVTDKSGKAIANIPVSFIDQDKGINYGTVSSNAAGYVVFHMDRIKSGRKSQVITAKLDLDSYLTVDTSNNYVQQVLKHSSLPTTKFYLTVSPSLIYFIVDERNFGEKLGIPVIEAELKNQLSGAGYKFTTSNSQSHLVITIKADTRRGGEVSGIYFSYVDITISVVERKSGKEIFKKSFNGYKASGSSFNHAGGKAYHNAKKDVSEKILELIAQ